MNVETKTIKSRSGLLNLAEELGKSPFQISIITQIFAIFAP